MDRTSLSLATDGLGRRLSPAAVARIDRFLGAPSAEAWSDICGIILTSEGGLTVWQALLEVDPSFPRTGRVWDAEGNLREEWKRVPTPLDVAAAIDYATR